MIAKRMGPARDMERILKVTLAGGTFDSTAGNARRMRAIRASGNKSTEARLRAALVRRGVTGWRKSQDSRTY